MEQSDNLCARCGGAMRTGETTFTAELGYGVVVVRNVPATVCGQCGEDWLTDETAETIEIIVSDARKKHSQVEVVGFATAAGT